MSQTDTDRNRNKLEVFNTILLSVATLAVAWCSYQGALWNGIQTFHLAESNKYGRLAQQKMIQSGQNKAMDEGVIITFVNAAFDKDSNKVNYILNGLRPELSAILSNWLKSNPFEKASAPRHPMVMPQYEGIMENRIKESEELSAKGAEMYKEAQQANLNGDTYTFLTVMFSMVMFLGAITTKLVRLAPRLTLTVISAIICVGSLVIVQFNMPIAHKG